MRTSLLVVAALLLALLAGCRGDTAPSYGTDTRTDTAGGDTAAPTDVAGLDGVDVAADTSSNPTPDAGGDTGVDTAADTGGGDPPPSTLARGCDGASFPGVPDDPALRGPWTVGARAVVVGGHPGEVWYPAAAGSADGLEPIRYDVRPYLPEADQEKVPDEQNPWQVCDCYRDLPIDADHGPYPLLVFVHGTAGYPMQSLEHVLHWVSRGFVVVAVVHRGLMLGDILTFQVERDVPGDLRDVLDAMRAPADDVAFLAGALDTSRIGLTGHSFGGASIRAFSGEPNVRVLAPMAGGGVDWPAGPSDLELGLVVGGLEDLIVPWSGLLDGFAGAPGRMALVGVADAGHLLPTSLCELGAGDGGLLTIAQANGVNVPAFVAALGTDGCGADQLPPAEGWDIVNAVSATAFEDVLQCTGAAAEQFAAIEARYEAVAVLETRLGVAPLAAATPFPWAGESWDAACSDGVDQDGNGYADCDDFGCSRNVAVTVCGTRAQYEGSPDACGNGRDDDGDGLVDCLDPDCAENPFHDVCPAPPVETGCEDGTDGDGDGFSGCDDYDCLLAGADACADVLADGAFVRVLFDQTLDESAAAGPNSDWMIDAYAARPTPSNPDGPNAWSGALSSFAYALWATGGFLVESLPSPRGRLTYGDDTNPQDLTGYDVLVLFEPSRAIAAHERRAILQFVRRGGGLLMVANHNDSDRDGNGTSAPQALNALLEDATFGDDIFGFRFNLVDIDTGRPLDDVRGDHPVTDGPAGAVAQIGFYQGCSAHLTGTNPTARGLVYLPAAPSDTTGIAVGVAEVGEGRVVFVTDSAIGGDGTDSHGRSDPGHDSWNNAGQSNAVLFQNAIHWLAGVGASAD